MAEITASSVKELREKTGAGMMDCKRALSEAQGDLVSAEEILRKKGISSADKKAGRATKEGVIAAAILDGGQVGLLAEINCETDFVAKTDPYKEFCELVVNSLAKDPASDLEEARVAAVAKVGENIKVSRSVRFAVEGNGLIASYIHLQGKVGVLVEVGCQSAETASAGAFRDLVKDLTLHIAAAHPTHVNRSEVPQGTLAKEREIYAAQVQGKPAQIVDKIVDGKIEKYYSSVCLLDQAFIKDPDQTIADLLKSKAGELGDVVIRQFARYAVGEELSAAEAEAQA